MTDAEKEKIDWMIAVWSMRPSPRSSEGQAWEQGCEKGFEWGLKQNKPLELCPCETEQLFLKPDQLYIFRVRPDCKRCVEMAEIAKVP